MTAVLSIHRSTFLPRAPLRAAALMLALLLPSLAARATVFVPISDAELADRSPLIVEARVLAVEPGPGPLPATDYQVAALRLLKGRLPGDLLIVRLPGGVRRDGVGLRLWGAPRFREGDEALLFLEPRRDGTFALREFLLGAFHLVSEGGTRFAIRDLSEALPLSLPGLAGPADGLRALDPFRRWIEDRAKGLMRTPDYFRDPPSSGPAAATPEKYRTVVSTSDPPPLGCGENGGHTARWFAFDDGGFAVLQDALEVWNDPNTPIDYRFLGVTSSAAGLSESDGVNSVLFGDPSDEIAGSFEGAGLLALSGPRFDCSLSEHRGELFHPLFEADVVTQDGLELFFADVPDPDRAAEQIFGHELGHTLGLAHSEVPEALMAADYHPDLRGAALHVDDLAGLHALYGPLELSPPAPPAGLTAALTFPNWVRLTWSDNSSNETVFRIERRRTGSYELVTTVAAGTTAFVDSDVLPQTLYSYRVRAQNGAGASAFSDTVEIETAEDHRPAAPTNLRAAPLSNSSVRLGWQDNADNESGFIIDIRVGSTWFEIPTHLPLDVEKVIVSGLPSASTFGFRVRSFNQFGRSATSNVTSATTFTDNSTCVVDDQELCLLGGRFEVSVRYRNQYDEGTEGQAVAVPETDENGLFWFFGPENIELIVKILDGRNLNQHFWVFYGALSDVEYWITVTDTQTGATEIYHTPPGELCGLGDILAFPGEPAPAGATAGAAAPRAQERIAELLKAAAMPPVAALDVSEVLAGSSPPRPLKTGSCQTGPENLCLLGDRLKVEVRWRNPHDGGTEGVGRAVADTDSTGLFWFFNLENTELVVKALDGSGLNDHLWIFYGALTDLEYWITVTDTVTGESRVYYNPPGEICGRADIEAFVIETPEEPPGAEPASASRPSD